MFLCTRRKSLACAILLCSLGATGNSATINLVGGTAGSIPGGEINDFITTGLFAGPQMGGYFGSEIEVSSSQPYTATYEYFGADGAFINTFILMGSVLFTHSGGTVISPNLATPLDSASFARPAETGLIPFSFTVNTGGGTVTNGSNPNDATGTVMGPNFFASCNPFGASAGSGGTSCSSVYVFLDDGGAGSDDNHDDMLVRITVTEIPEPGTWLLLGAGLIGLGALRRPRQIRG